MHPPGAVSDTAPGLWATPGPASESVQERIAMKRFIKHLIRAISGQDIAEYGIAIAVIVVAVIFVAFAIGGNVNAIWTGRESIIGNAANAV
jgi:Flp pilus assembly pilin Flp